MFSKDDVDRRSVLFTSGEFALGFLGSGEVVSLFERLYEYLGCWVICDLVEGNLSLRRLCGLVRCIVGLCVFHMFVFLMCSCSFWCRIVG